MKRGLLAGSEPEEWVILSLTPAQTSGSEARALTEEDLNELTFQLHAIHTVGSVELYPDQSIKCVLSQNACEAALALWGAFGYIATSCRALSKLDWHNTWQRQWEVVTVRNLSIVPVESASAAPSPSAHTIALIPGFGFGTGHHPTTQAAIALISDYASEYTPTTSRAPVLDLGTGSGVLALAAQRLLGIPVVAVDNDPLAIANARENLSINKVDEVALVVGTAACLGAHHFQLIVANLYAEILIELVSAIGALSHSGTELILAGIMSEKDSNVIQAYQSSFWRVRARIEREGWVAYRLTWK